MCFIWNKQSKIKKSQIIKLYEINSTTHEWNHTGCWQLVGNGKGKSGPLSLEPTENVLLSGSLLIKHSILVKRLWYLGCYKSTCHKKFLKLTWFQRFLPKLYKK